MIYVIGIEQKNWRDAPIKIGYTGNSSPKKRLLQIQTSNPRKLKVINTMSGDIKQEKIIHDYLYAFRLSGEWFDTRSMPTGVVTLLKTSNSAIGLCLKMDELLSHSILEKTNETIDVLVHSPQALDKHNNIHALAKNEYIKDDRYVLTNQERDLVREIQSRLKSNYAL